MTKESIPGEDKLELQISNWKQLAVKLYVPHAQGIVNLIETTPMCIVPGRFGVGKTSFLKPALQEEFLQRGYTSLWQDAGQLLEASWRRAYCNRFREAERRVIILDEAGEIPRFHPGKALEMADDFHQQGIGVVGIVAYGTQHPELREQSVEEWKSVSQKVMGEELLTYTLPYPIVTAEVARAFLSSKKTLSVEAINYIINNVPLNWKIITNIFGQSLEEVVFDIKNNAFNWFTMELLSEEECASLRDKLAI